MQHMRPCPLTSTEQKRERLIREAKVAETRLTEGRIHALNLYRGIKKKDTYCFFT